MHITLDTQSSVLPSFFRRSEMANESKQSGLDTVLRNAVKDEIGDVEDMKFPEKNMLHQKFGVIPAVVTKEEILYWEMRQYPTPKNGTPYREIGGRSIPHA